MPESLTFLQSVLRTGYLRHRTPTSLYLMRIIMPDRTERVCLGKPVTVEQLLLELGINPLEVMVTRGGKLLPETAPVHVQDELRIIMVSHGG